MTRPPSYDLREITLGDAAALVKAHHAYGGTGNTAVACFGVVERSQVVAAYVWMPAARAVAAKVAPSAPGAALALSRMVAVPRELRELRHVSRPLRRQMRVLLDRGRWPVLVTYSDESQGHTGHVYRCSGWQPTDRVKRPAFEDAAGRRVSAYRAGVTATGGLTRIDDIWLQRWEHRVCGVGEERDWLEAHGWSYADGGRAKWAQRTAPLLDWASSMTAPAPNPWDALERSHDCAACPSWEASGCETADGCVCRCACHDATVTPESAHRAADALGLHIVAADGAEVLA